VVDASQPLTNADRTIAALVQEKPVVVVLNKIDLLATTPEVQQLVRNTHGTILDAPRVPLSALTGEGLEALEEAMVEIVFSGQVMATDAPMVTSPRHKEALGRALDHVQAAHTAYQARELADLVAIDLAAAVHTLGEITGQTASDDLIESIFSTFCIGK